MNANYLKSFFLLTSRVVILACLFSPFAQAQSKVWTKITTPDRFSIIFPGAVLDKETNLVWEQTPSNSGQAFADANDFCPKQIIGGVNGWRSPTVAEFSTLVDPAMSTTPMLPAGHPFLGLPSDPLYWSSTTSEANPLNAFFVRFKIGVPNVELGPKTAPLMSWCVRGGSNR